MNESLTLTIHRWPSGTGNSADILQAMLWSGPLQTDDPSIIFNVHYRCRNFFECLAFLKQDSEKWRDRCNRPEVRGLTDLTDLWPVNPERVTSFEREWIMGLLSAQLSFVGGQRGLLCSVSVKDLDAGTARIFEIMPMPSPVQLQGASFNLSAHGSNIFHVAQILFDNVKTSARQACLSRLVGIDDGAPCWPEGLGKLRFDNHNDRAYRLLRK